MVGCSCQSEFEVGLSLLVKIVELCDIREIRKAWVPAALSSFLSFQKITYGAWFAL
jgi:hypothetical protein